MFTRKANYVRTIALWVGEIIEATGACQEDLCPIKNGLKPFQVELTKKKNNQKERMACAWKDLKEQNKIQNRMQKVKAK